MASQRSRSNSCERLTGSSKSVLDQEVVPSESEEESSSDGEECSPNGQATRNSSSKSVASSLRALPSRWEVSGRRVVSSPNTEECWLPKQRSSSSDAQINQRLELATSASSCVKPRLPSSLKLKSSSIIQRRASRVPRQRQNQTTECSVVLKPPKSQRESGSSSKKGQTSSLRLWPRTGREKNDSSVSTSRKSRNSSHQPAPAPKTGGEKGSGSTSKPAPCPGAISKSRLTEEQILMLTQGYIALSNATRSQNSSQIPTEASGSIPEQGLNQLTSEMADLTLRPKQIRKKGVTSRLRAALRPLRPLNSANKKNPKSLDCMQSPPSEQAIVSPMLSPTLPRHSPPPPPTLSPPPLPLRTLTLPIRSPRKPKESPRPPLPAPREGQQDEHKKKKQVSDVEKQLGWIRNTFSFERVDGLQCNRCKAGIIGLQSMGSNFTVDESYQEKDDHCCWYYERANQDVTLVIPRKHKCLRTTLPKGYAMIRIMHMASLCNHRYLCVDCFNVHHPKLFKTVTSQLAHHAAFVSPNMKMCSAAYNFVEEGQRCSICSSYHSSEEPCDFPPEYVP